MLKVCSFLPAVTQMLYDMGLQDHLYGVTFECPEEALQEKTPIVRCVLEGKDYTSQEIDAVFSESKHEGKKLYYVDEVLLAEVAPDIIFTQDICDVCQIDMECTSRAVANLSKKPELISISPASLKDVFDNALTIARVLGKEEVAFTYLKGLNKRIELVNDTLYTSNTLHKQVMLMEWLDPIYNCGHWIPHQIKSAGGIDLLSNPSGDSRVVSWQTVLNYDPEILIIAPCGFMTDRTLLEMELLTKKEGWFDLKAVRKDRVFIADFDLFTQSSAASLVNGIELLAGLFHPEIISIPQNLIHKFKKFHSQKALGPKL